MKPSNSAGRRRLPFLPIFLSVPARWICGLLLAATATVSSAQLKLFDAANLGEASGMVHASVSLNDAIRLHCAKAFPAAKAHLDHAYFVWLMANEDEIVVAEKIYGELESGKRAALENGAQAAAKALLDALQSGGRVEAACAQQIQTQRDGEQNVARRTPKASAFLKDYLAAHPRTAGETARLDFVRGCRKQSLNNGQDFDEVMPRCACLAEVHFTQLSEAERSDYATQTRARKPAAELMQLSYMRRIQPAMLRCLTGA